MGPQDVYYVSAQLPNGKWFWKIMAGNDMPLGCSVPLYDSKTECDMVITGINHIHTVKKPEDTND